MDSGKFIPVAVTSNPVANNVISSGKQKVGGKMNKTKYFRLRLSDELS